ncbi:hypothetical protein AOLI_G00029620 [Acnodon oligacanthus]
MHRSTARRPIRRRELRFRSAPFHISREKFWLLRMRRGTGRRVYPHQSRFSREISAAAALFHGVIKYQTQKT